LCAVFQEEETGSEFRNDLPAAGFALKGHVGRELHDDLLVGRCRQDRHLVLVPIVDFIESPNEFVPRLVMLDRAENVHRSLMRGLFYGFETGFQFVGILNQREVLLPLPGSPLAPSLMPKDVERSAEVVNGVGGNRSESRGDIVTSLDDKPYLPPLRIELTDRRVRVGFQEGSAGEFKISDVLFGPFDLSPTAGRPISHGGDA